MDTISSRQSAPPSIWVPKHALPYQAIRITKYCCGLLALVAAFFEIEGYTYHAFPNIVYKIGYGLLASAIVGFALSCFYSSKASVHPKKNEEESKVILVPPEKIKDLNIATQIHELCEMDTQGKYKLCTQERLVEIISELKEKKLSYALNTVPEYYLEHYYRKTACDKPNPLYTPLQYWGAQGNLVAVDILFQAGAVDFCCPYEDFHHILKSALYFAALHGHSKIVKYLLENGANVSLLFDQNILYSFIPHLIFELCQELEISQQSIDCLQEILSHLFLNNNKNLKIQLKVPVDVKQNSVKYANASNQNTLEKLLEQFGGKKEDVFSNKQLKEMNYHTGTGFTLEEQSGFK